MNTAPVSQRIVPEVQPLQKSLNFESASSLVSAIRPDLPVHCLRPQAIRRAAHWFNHQFPGHVLYAVKSNPSPLALTTLWESGIRRFDVASLAEVAQIHELFPEAKQYFMHPVKSRESIRKAYFDYGVRAFSLDSMEELYKILETTDNAQDLELFVRLHIPNEHAALELSSKFGVALDKADELLRVTEAVCAKLGVCFHVGSQSMDPADFHTALTQVKGLVDRSGVTIDALDVGGGFPAAYPGFMPPALASYIEVIRESVATLGYGEVELLCEPGRALVAEVQARRGKMLYINDGTYGSLFDAGQLKWNYPLRAIRPNGKFSGEMQDYGFWGPTCDSMDVMAGPFRLPADMQEGDWIEIGQMGAYGAAMRSNFNGLGEYLTAVVEDAPLLTLFK
jgi:ornithine decarboxylase